MLLCVGVWIDTCTFTPICFPQQHEADTGILFKDLYFFPNLEGTPCSIITHFSTNLFKPGESRADILERVFGKSLGSLGGFKKWFWGHLFLNIFPSQA